jgi:2-oxo-4-hydroxy-4-carboxy-5-ureidoimidazoline decarboxylase
MTLTELNRMDRDAFVRALGGVFEHSPWIAAIAWERRPFVSVGALHDAMVDVVRDAGAASQLALLRAHPELAGRAMVRRELTADSTLEQAGAGLADCSPEEFARLQDLNARYNEKFGFPFILAVKGLDRARILREFARRLADDRDVEFTAAVAQVGRIARFRLDALLAAPATPGAAPR